MGHGFPKRMRLRKRSEYLFAQRHERRRKLHTRHFLVIVAPKTAPNSVGEYLAGSGRIGITVSKKVGNAVVRNRIKRCVREFVRTRPEWLPAGHDVVVIAKQSASSAASVADVSRELGALETRLCAR